VKPFPWIDVAVIAGLVVLNGLFAMSEMAIISSRPARLRAAVERGSHGAALALKLSEDPGRFLSTVQSGITLVGIVAGAFSGVSLGEPIGDRLELLGLSAQWAPRAGFAIAIAVTTYLNLVVGELVPKRLALAGAEPIAIVAARPIAVFARITAPLVWLLDASSDLLLGLIGARGITRPHVTAEELHLIVAEASRTGAIEEDERAIITGIMRLADRPVREVMTPRTEIDWIEAGANEAEIRQSIAQSPHSLLAVADGSPDTIIGVVKVREVLAEMLAGRTPSIAALSRKAEIIPDQLDAMDALRILQQSGISMGLVHDEYGHLEGIVTPTDLLTAIVGSFASHQDEGDGPLIEENADGSLLVAGALPADALADRLDLDLPDARDYATAAGYALSVLRRLPDAGDAFTVQNWRFEVVEMDGRRIERLRVSPLARPPQAA
jgi:putative hemolysin